MRAQSAESWFLTKSDEDRFAEGLRKTLISDYPNPSREGCPDPKTIHALAFHKRIADPESFERITNHMAECSACVRDALGSAEEYKTIINRRRAVSLAVALVLTAALWTMWHTQSPDPPMAKSPDIPNDSTPAIADAAARITEPPVIPKLTPVVIALPLSWRGATTTERPIILPRGHLQLEIRLPIGSPPGTYELRISDTSGKVQKTAESTTSSVGGLALLQITLDTIDLIPGSHNLQVLEPGAAEWATYSTTIR